MKFISEKVIEEVIGAFEQSEKLESKIRKDFQETQPILFSYLFSDSFKFLTESEKEFLLYLALLIFETSRRENDLSHPIDSETINQYEEANWAIFNENNKGNFRQRLDTFFQDYPQEDLLALVEDSMTDEEEEDDYFNLTKEGKELIFVGLKSLIDSLHYSID